MTAPNLAASSQKNSINTTLDLVADAMTIQSGDVIVVKAGTWSNSVAPSASGPSATGLTFTQRAAETGGGFNGDMYLWTAVAASNLGSTVITLPGPSSNCHHAASFEVWRGGQLAASPVVATGFTTSNTAVDVAITTSTNDSVVTWGFYDNNSTYPGGTQVYRNGAVEINIVQPPGSNGIFWFAYQVVATAGATDYGVTTPTNLKWNAAGIEILALTGGPVDLAGAGSAAAGFTGALGRDRGVQGHADGSSGFSGDAGVARALAASGAASAGLSGAVDLTRAVAGSGDSASYARATLTVTGQIIQIYEAVHTIRPVVTAHFHARRPSVTRR